MIFSENYRLRPCGAEACELSNPRREVTGCIVEINPVIDLHNKTALLGVEMVLSALGKKIL